MFPAEEIISRRGRFMVLNVGRDQPGFKIRILKPGIVTFWKFFGLGWKILEVHLKWMFQ